LESRYRVYGLNLRSSRPLPHLLAEPADRSDGAEDVRVVVGDRPGEAMPDTEAVDWIPVSNRRLSAGQRVWSGVGSDGIFLRLRYQGTYEGRYMALEFVIHPNGREVWGAWSESAPVKSIDDVTSLLLGAVLAYVLRLRGTICLHACAVAVGSRSVVLLGDPGLGKSTAAAAMARRGHPVLSDDLAAVTYGGGGDDGSDGASWTTQPGYPRLRLLSAAIDSFGAPGDHGPVISGLELDKRYLDLSAEDRAGPWRFQPEPLPLDAIYLLQRHPDFPAPAIDPIAGGDRLTTLLAYTSAPFAPLDQRRRAREFARLGQMASTVPVLRVRCPHGLERLPELCEAIAEDVASRGRG
jgi:hypothetical protein